MDEQIASVLSRAFPDREVAEVKSSGPSWNDQNRTVGIDFADGASIFLKMSNEGDGSRIARERAVIDYVRENCSVSVPKVVAADTGGDVPYLATAPVSGQNFIHLWSDASATRRAALARQVGKSLATVHSLRFEKPRPRRRWQCDHPRTRNRAMDGRSHRHGSRTTGTCLLEPVRPPFRCGGFSRRSES